MIHIAFRTIIVSLLALPFGVQILHGGGQSITSLAPTEQQTHQEIAEAKSQMGTKNIVVSFAGDCTFGTVNGDDGSNRFPSVFRRSKVADYPFALVQPWFVNDDLTVVNFECTLTKTERTANKQWKFKGDASYANLFAKSSVDLVSLANNHSFDYLQQGFNDTLDNFTRAHVPVVYQSHPFVTTIKGTQVVVIADCTVTGENTTDIDGTPQRVLSEIRSYKKPGNVVVVFMHWGSELASTPFLWEQAMGREFIDAGADAVVGSHPHVLQGIEEYRGKYIAYSLGNFAFGGNSLARRPETAILRLVFALNPDQPPVETATIVPCYITSTTATNAAGDLINDYQPTPVFGDKAKAVEALLLERSSNLKDGIKTLRGQQLP